MTMLVDYKEQLGKQENSWRYKLKRFLKKLLYKYLYKANKELFQSVSNQTIDRLQSLYYTQKIKEIKSKILALEEDLRKVDYEHLLQDLSSKSMALLKGFYTTNIMSEKKNPIILVNYHCGEQRNFWKSFQ